MSEAIKQITQNDEHLQRMRLAEFQQWFLQRYARELPEDLRHHFQRELLYMIHLTYREAQEPLTKQLTDFVVSHSRPILQEYKL